MTIQNLTVTEVKSISELTAIAPSNLVILEGEVITSEGVENIKVLAREIAGKVAIELVYDPSPEMNQWRFDNADMLTRIVLDAVDYFFPLED